jgi:hypothetical protein
MLLEKITNVVIDIVEIQSIKNCGLKVSKNGINYHYVGCASSFNILEIQPENIPIDFHGRKYSYINNTFVLDPNFIDPDGGVV